jgi:oligoribonuclease NrnB/cAMP/cGMP phosphodiesterase (DHH superfamily)
MRSNINGLETLDKISFYPPEDIVIGYHDDMDGMLAAVAVKHKIKEIKGEEESKVKYQKMQYHKDRTTGLDGLLGKKLVILVDFCMPKESEFAELKESGLEEIHIYDHHKTAMEFIEQISLAILEPEFNYVHYYFDMSKSGCTIAYEQFIESQKNGYIISNGLSKLNMLQKYAADRDLWKFELENSKDINAGLTLISKELNLLKNPDIMYNFIFGDPDAIDTLTLEEKFGADLKIVNQDDQTLLDSCKLVGKLSVTFDNMYIDKFKHAATKGSIPLIEVGGIKMFVLNNGHLVSEVGNMLTEFGYPSVQYFIIHEVKDGILKEPELVLSFRSTDDLPDVSIVAKALGGGGHRNACGVGMKITDLDKLLKSEI